MSNQDPLNQLGQYQSYLQNQNGQDDPFQLTPDALLQLVVQQLASGKNGNKNLGTDLTRLSSINTLLGKPAKAQYDKAYVAPTSVQRTLYGQDPNYSQLFDQIDKGTPLSTLGQAIQKPESAFSQNGYDPTEVNKVAADYATERVTNANHMSAFQAANPNPAPTPPTREALIAQFTKQFAPSQTAEAKKQSLLSKQLDFAKKGGGIATADQARTWTAVQPHTSAADDVRRQRVIEQVLSKYGK